MWCGLHRICRGYCHGLLPSHWFCSRALLESQAWCSRPAALYWFHPLGEVQALVSLGAGLIIGPRAHINITTGHFGANDLPVLLSGMPQLAPRHLVVWFPSSRPLPACPPFQRHQSPHHGLSELGSGQLLQNSGCGHGAYQVSLLGKANLTIGCRYGILMAHSCSYCDHDQNYRHLSRFGNPGPLPYPSCNTALRLLSQCDIPRSRSTCRPNRIPADFRFCAHRQ